LFINEEQSRAGLDVIRQARLLPPMTWLEYSNTLKELTGNAYNSDPNTGIVTDDKSNK